MGPGFGDEVGKALAIFVMAAIAIAFTLGVVAMWGLPLAWEWLKPLIHAATE